MNRRKRRAGTSPQLVALAAALAVGGFVPQAWAQPEAPTPVQAVAAEVRVTGLAVEFTAPETLDPGLIPAQRATLPSLEEVNALEFRVRLDAGRLVRDDTTRMSLRQINAAGPIVVTSDASDAIIAGISTRLAEFGVYADAIEFVPDAAGGQAKMLARVAESVVPVGAITIGYEGQAPEQVPPVGSFSDLSLIFGVENGALGRYKGSSEWRQVTLGELSSTEVKQFTRGGLAEIQTAIADRLSGPSSAGGLSLVGVFVVPDPEQIVPDRDGRLVDNRAGDTGLKMLIRVGTLAEVRTIALGTRVPESERVNSPLHDRIRRNSPLNAPAEGVVGPAINAEAVDAYVARLNRFPARRVDTAVSSWTGADNQMVLDYLVSESKPWIAYAQISNNGTESTDEWRTRVGMADYQFTNRDDIFSIEAMTGLSFDLDVWSITAGYDTPLGDSEKVRLRFNAGASSFDASELGGVGQSFKGTDGAFSTEAAVNIFQRGSYFSDLVGGVRYRYIDVENSTTGVLENANTHMVEPFIGVRSERASSTDQLESHVHLVFGWLSESNDSDRDVLGRVETDDSYWLLEGGVSRSLFLEPIFDRDAFNRGDSTLAHEVFFSVNGQAVLDGSRLLAQRENTLGGMYTVRGYPESTAAGDHTIVATAEYRLHISRLLQPYSGSDQPTTDILGRGWNRDARGWWRDPFLWRPPHAYGLPDWNLMVRTFVDGGMTFINDRESFENEEDLLSVGLGLELKIRNNFTFRADWGVALLDVGASGAPGSVEAGDNRFHFVFTFLY
jgi:hemolysin activation/secretion protein